MCKMKLTAIHNKDIVVLNEKFSAAIIHRGYPKSDTPKTYKEIGGFIAKELSYGYNSGCVSIYQAKDKTLRYSVYQDGCFYPYYGKIELIK